MTDKMNTIKVTKPSERELTVTRNFVAPRELVFDAFTKPDVMKHWFYGPDEWPLEQCEVDLRAGGTYRYLWRHAEKGEMGVSGVFREVVPPERIVHTEVFDEDWTGGETLVTTLFEEHNGKTTVTATVRYASRDARDGALKTGMIDGWSAMYDRLDALAPSLATAAP